MLPTRLNPLMVATYTAAGFWDDESIYQLAARQGRTIPGDFVVRDRYRRLTYAALVDAADRLAASLAGHGITAGDHVAVWLPSRVETAIALLACSRNGYVCCPSLHRNHRVGEILALVDRTRAAAVIAEPGYGADADRRDLFAELESREFVRLGYRVGPARNRNDAIRRDARRRHRGIPEQRREPGDVPAVHLRYDRRAEGCHA
jgi:non-ribosomal peptide synthetase component E (peptide arylation enzyme)